LIEIDPLIELFENLLGRLRIQEVIGNRRRG